MLGPYWGILARGPGSTDRAKLNRLEGFVESSNIYNSEPFDSVISNNGASLNFVTFAVPRKIKEKVVDLLYYLRVTLNRRKKVGKLRSRQTLKNCNFPDKT